MCIDFQWLPFNDQARDRSYELQASMHRRALALLAGLVAAVLSVLSGWRAASTDAE
ncbi:hypothetical protein [Natrinema limicola]|uniref:hypothetical protein n=1 Tax=Natrinema limicola TaxID=370323 RepID=UPI000A540CB8|nr:hypothetical protein [Natrinema limicola]